MSYEGNSKTYARDSFGRVTKEEYTTGESASYSYNPAGYMTEFKETDKNGMARRQTGYAYTDSGLLGRRTGPG